MLQKLKGFLDSFLTHVWTSIETLFVTLKSHLGDPKKTISLVVLVVLALDIVFKGSMGVIAFLIGQAKSIFDILKSPDLNTIVMCLLAFLLYDKISSKK